MANKDTYFGARAVGHLMGSMYTARIRKYVIPATDATALYVGDFVKVTGESDNDENGKNHSVVTRASAGEKLVGFVVGFEANSSYLNQIYRTASTLRGVFVVDDPYITFEIQAKGTLGTGDLQLLANITVSAGSTVTGVSGTELDLTTKTSSTGQLRMLALSPREDNDFGLYAKVICMINNHQYKATTGV
jgi:hypothetical protein